MEINELVFEEEKPQLQGDLQRRKTLPSFVKKLWFIINDSATDCYACWTDNGQKIYVPDAAAFAKSVLPQYFKHNNWQSFVRQLNLYGFRKVCDSEVSASPSPCDQRPASEGWQFRHDCFRRDSSHLLHHIVRKRGHCRQPLSDTSLSPMPAPPAAAANNNNNNSSKALATAHEDDEVPSRLARIETVMQEMEAKTATAHDCILQLRLTQTQQNETLCSLLALAKVTLKQAKVGHEHIEQLDHLHERCQKAHSSPEAKHESSHQLDHDHEFRVLPSTSSFHSPAASPHRRHVDGYSTVIRPLTDPSSEAQEAVAKRRRVSLPHISDAFAPPSTESRMATIRLPPLISAKSLIPREAQ